MSAQVVRDVLVKAIMVTERLRPLRDSLVDELTESMSTRGLIQPISITYPNGQATPELVVGAHRLEAAKRLKWETIASAVVPYADADQIRLVEIDENLIRGELSPAERAIHIAERKRRYEAIHPETKVGAAPGKAGGGKKAKADKLSSFAKDTASKTGRTDRDVRRDATRAKHIPQITDLIGTSLDQGEELDALAKLPHKQQADLIARACAGENISVKSEAKRAARAEREQELAEQAKTASAAIGHRVYGVIYADPPWRFEPFSRESGLDRSADNHYPTMTVDEICALQVPAADRCVLFLWATVPMLLEALRVMAAWGFAYRSHFVWVKDRRGTGYWNRNRHELLLIGVRGDVPAPAPGEQYDSVIEARVGVHSAKPQHFAEMIEDMFRNTPMIELFARKPRLGWDVWGNQVVLKTD